MEIFFFVIFYYVVVVCWELVFFGIGNGSVFFEFVYLKIGDCYCGVNVWSVDNVVFNFSFFCFYFEV